MQLAAVDEKPLPGFQHQHGAVDVVVQPPAAHHNELHIVVPVAQRTVIDKDRNMLLPQIEGKVRRIVKDALGLVGGIAQNDLHTVPSRERLL